MSSMFARYDEEFTSIAQQIQSKTSNLPNEGKNKGSSIKFISGLLKQADDLVKQMDMEAREVNDRELQRKTKEYKKNLSALRADFDSARASADRDGLFGDAGGDGRGSSSGLSNDHRSRMAETTAKVGRQNDTLENARRVMAETEDVALEITQELDRNRAKIQASRDKVLDVHGMMNVARRVVGSMSKRESQQKMIMWGVAGIMLIIIIVVIYFSTKKKK